MRTMTADELLKDYDYTVVCETPGTRGDAMRDVAFRTMNGAQAKALALKLRSGLDYEVVRIEHEGAAAAQGGGS